MCAFLMLSTRSICSSSFFIWIPLLELYGFGFSPLTDGLHRVREGSEVEIPCANCRHHLTRRRRVGAADILEFRQHEERALVPTEILETARDLSFLDEKSSVACESSQENRAGIQKANVEEVRDQNSTLRSSDEIVSRFRATDHLES